MPGTRCVSKQKLRKGFPAGDGCISRGFAALVKGDAATVAPMVAENAYTVRTRQIIELIGARNSANAHFIKPDTVSSGDEDVPVGIYHSALEGSHSMGQRLEPTFKWYLPHRKRVVLGSHFFPCCVQLCQRTS